MLLETADCRLSEIARARLKSKTPLKAAKRELKEELEIVAGEYFKLGKIRLDTSIVKNETAQYIARKLTFGKPHRDSEEKMKIVKIKFTEAVEKVLNGEMNHAPSCVLILKV